MLQTRGTADPAAAKTLPQEPGDGRVVVVALGATVIAASAGALPAPF
jgi:hypothetical protein